MHGCTRELTALLRRLGYDGDRPGRHPDGRRAVFVGDYVDRGPDSPGTLRVAMSMTAAGNALCVAGNHDRRLGRVLDGARVPLVHGLEATLDQLAREPAPFGARVREFVTALPRELVLDDGRLVVSHAGGVPTGVARPPEAVVHGHVPVDEPTWTHGTLDVDTGCVYGGRLTALRWPERELVSVPAGRVDS